MVVGRRAPLLALVVPLVLVGLVDGVRGLRETWVAALACGVAFAAAQFAVSNYVSAQLADICAALAGAAALLAVPHARVPAAEELRAALLTGARGAGSVRTERRRAGLETVPAGQGLAGEANRVYDWPFLDVVNPKGEPVGGNLFTWPIVSTGGTLVLFAGIATAAVCACTRAWRSRNGRRPYASCGPRFSP